MLEIDFRSRMEALGLSIQDLADMTGLTYRKLHHMIAEHPTYVSLEVVGRVLLALEIKVQPPFYLHKPTGENQDAEANSTGAGPPTR